MSNDHLMSRRAFTVESVLAILATATITITGCDGGSDLGPSPPAGAREGVVSNNHGHRAIVDGYSSQLHGRGIRALLQLVCQPLLRGTIPTGSRSSPVVLLRAGSTAEWVAHPHGDLGEPSTADRAPCQCCRGH